MPTPLIRRKDEPGFTPIPWDPALQIIAEHVKKTDPGRMGWFATSRGVSNECYYTL